MEITVLIALTRKYGLLLEDVHVLKDPSILELLVRLLTKTDALFFLIPSGVLKDVSVDLVLQKLASNVSAMEPKMEISVINVLTSPIPC